jgi:hypothetical protein
MDGHAIRRAQLLESFEADCVKRACEGVSKGKWHTDPHLQSGQ